MPTTVLIADDHPLFRQALDNLYITNNQGYAVDWKKGNMGDLLVSRPGRIVRTEVDHHGEL